MTYTLKTIIPLAFVFAFLVATNFLYAAWTAPTAAAPGDNAPAPINVGISTTSTQVGFGMLSFDYLVAWKKVQSSKYCDESGENCSDPVDIFTAVNGGGANTASTFSSYHTKSDYLNKRNNYCSCKSGDILTGCSGFQRSDHTTQAQDSATGDYCMHEGTGQPPVCSCLTAN